MMYIAVNYFVVFNFKFTEFQSQRHAHTSAITAKRRIGGKGH